MRQHVYLCTQKSVEPDYWKSEGCIRSPHSKKQWPEDEDEKPTEMEYRIPDATQSGGDAKKRLAMFNGAVSKNPRGIFHYLSANSFIPEQGVAYSGARVKHGLCAIFCDDLRLVWFPWSCPRPFSWRQDGENRGEEPVEYCNFLIVATGKCGSSAQFPKRNEARRRKPDFRRTRRNWRLVNEDFRLRDRWEGMG